RLSIQNSPLVRTPNAGAFSGVLELREALWTAPAARSGDGAFARCKRFEPSARPRQKRRRASLATAREDPRRRARCPRTSRRRLVCGAISPAFSRSAAECNAPVAALLQTSTV